LLNSAEGFTRLLDEIIGKNRFSTAANKHKESRPGSCAFSTAIEIRLKRIAIPEPTMAGTIAASVGLLSSIFLLVIMDTISGRSPTP
jgi:hypothetical protein